MDHYALAVARLPEVYKDKPKFLAWLAAYCAKIQEIDDVLIEIMEERLLQNSPTGDLLAKIGLLVGQANLTGADSTFRLMIQARILANRSDGRRRDMIAVTRALWSYTNQPDVWVFDMTPATVLIIPQLPVELDPYIMFEHFLQPAVGAGIRLLFIWTVVPMAQTLMFGDSSGAFVPASGQLLSNSGGSFTGGLLAGTV